MKPKNKPIGECPCPVKGCAATAQVFKFAARPAEVKRRFAGKLYGHCPAHGRFGGDGSAGIQEFILEHATLWKEGEKGAGQAPANPAEKPAAVPAVVTAKGPEKTPEPVKKFWDLWEM